MNSDPGELISAFLDGEAVPPADLSRALTLPDAREMLVDFVLLRAGIRADACSPDPRFTHKMERALAAPRMSIARFFSPAPVIAAVGMAAVLLLVLWTGGPGPELPLSIEQTPPAVDRVLPFEPGVDWEEL